MAKNVAGSFAQLESMIRVKVKEALQDEVAKEVTEIMVKEIIPREVYKKYTPSSYTREYELVNPNNVESKLIDDNTLSVRNVRSDGSRDVAYVVESGKGYYNKALDAMIGPRPFHEKTRGELVRSKRHLKAMKKGLEARLGKGSVV